ncbi:hypothetical protein DQ237_03755 [Blastococcus sp. TF02-8]|uniref:hypothetical protein n=1 Tax=Blastococcus sp. TF02-8 TaxID=2250574 RepID=UPI000DE89806|nr:hypothetical protein [Blastococcus sp. TF02-8]RBY98019.1 hypothetical protein DQ237_03755 [Blastococcus sp. TF02-8]
MLLALGGLAAIVLVVVAAFPREWWPRRSPSARWRVALAGPTGVRAGELAGTDDALVHTTSDDVRRWIPLTGPTAAAGAVAAPGQGAVALRMPGATLDVTPRDPAAVGELIAHLENSGVRVEQVATVPRPRVEAMIPSGAMGDARWSAGLMFAAVGGATAATVLGAGAEIVWVAPLGLATLLALGAGLTGLRARAALRRP